MTSQDCNTQPKPSRLTPIATLALATMVLSFSAQAKKEMMAAPDWPGTAFESAGIDPATVVTFANRDEPQALSAPRTVPLTLSIETKPRDPVIVVELNGETRAYPLTIVAAHEVVNDELGGVPIAVTYCRICSAAVVFDRRLDGETTTFHLTGFLNNDNIVLYDSATERWWQQYDGMSLSGSPSAPTLKTLRAQVTSYEKFQEKHAGSYASILLSTEKSRLPLAAGTVPVVLDSAGLPLGVSSRERLIVIGQQAFPLSRLEKEKRIESDGLVINWEPGRNAAPDIFGDDRGRDVGNVDVYRYHKGEYLLVPESFKINLAHSFRTFVKGGVIEFEPAVSGE